MPGQGIGLIRFQSIPAKSQFITQSIASSTPVVYNPSMYKDSLGIIKLEESKLVENTGGATGLAFENYKNFQSQHPTFVNLNYSFSSNGFPQEVPLSQLSGNAKNA
jgi:hypothetical protein